VAVVFSSISLQGFLSFGPEASPIELRDVNVLLGPNGSGKSNLVEALDVLRAAPGDLPVPIRQGGGVREWLWKGANREVAQKCILEAIAAPGVVGRAVGRTQRPDPAVRYTLQFGAEGDRFTVINERIEDAQATQGAKPYFYFGYEPAGPMLNQAGKNKPRHLKRDFIDSTQSILSQRRDPDEYPELARLADTLSAIRIYRNWTFGPSAPIRGACTADARTDRLTEAMDNLPARIGGLNRDPDTRRRLLLLVGAIADGYKDINLVPEGGMLSLYLTEGDRSFPARRLSDGTLRMLALGAILLAPAPNSILVIEEPELGLHPDLMPTLRDLLLSAAKEAQVIVTTHSTVLADAFTRHPESVLMVEKHQGDTEIRRLCADDLADASGAGIGALWMAGRLGGTRW
jgi:predicted ATPase